jgi:hypothetical protein
MLRRPMAVNPAYKTCRSSGNELEGIRIEGRVVT